MSNNCLKYFSMLKDEWVGINLGKMALSDIGIFFAVGKINVFAITKFKFSNTQPLRGHNGHVIYINNSMISNNVQQLLKGTYLETKLFSTRIHSSCLPTANWTTHKHHWEKVILSITVIARRVKAVIQGKWAGFSSWS